MFIFRIIFPCLIGCFALLFISCTSKTKTGTDNVPVDKDVSSIEGTQLLDSLDIRLQLSESIFIGSPEKIEMKLINNSGYTVLTGNPYLLKRFEFGYWSVVPEFEKMI